jgi:membrane protein DedA with SNARE-associated domain
MIGFLLGIPGKLKLYAAAILAAFAGAFALYAKGRADAKARHVVKDLKQEVQTHDRINKADTGAGLSDDERIDRLREFADRHGKRK